MLKPGGLALVIKAYNPNNLGKCVELQAFIPPKGDVITPDGGLMENWTKKGMWYATGDVTTTFFSGRQGKGYALFRPEQLLPLGEDPDVVEEKEGELEHSN